MVVAVMVVVVTAAAVGVGLEKEAAVMVAEGTEVVVRAVGALPARRDSQLHRGPSHPSSASLGFAALRARGAKTRTFSKRKGRVRRRPQSHRQTDPKPQTRPRAPAPPPRPPRRRPRRRPPQPRRPTAACGAAGGRRRMAICACYSCSCLAACETRRAARGGAAAGAAVSFTECARKGTANSARDRRTSYDVVSARMALWCCVYVLT